MRPKKKYIALWIILIAFVVLILAALLAALLAPESESLNQYTELFLKQFIEKRYYFDIEFDEVHVKYLPLSFNLKGVHFYKTGTREELIHIKEMTVGLSYRRLLLRQFYYPRVDIVEADILFPIEDHKIFFGRRMPRPRNPGGPRIYIGKINFEQSRLRLISHKTSFKAITGEVNGEILYRNIIGKIDATFRADSGDVAYRDLSMNIGSLDFSMSIDPNSINLKEYRFFSPETQVDIEANLYDMSIDPFIPGVNSEQPFLKCDKVEYRSHLTPKSPMSIKDYIAGFKLDSENVFLAGNKAVALKADGEHTKKYLNITGMQMDFPQGKISGSGNFDFTPQRYYETALQLKDFPIGRYLDPVKLKDRRIDGPINLGIRSRGFFRSGPAKEFEIEMDADPLSVSWPSAAGRRSLMTLSGFAANSSLQTTPELIEITESAATFKGGNELLLHGSYFKDGNIDLDAEFKSGDLSEIKLNGKSRLAGSGEASGRFTGDRRNPDAVGTYTCDNLEFNRLKFDRAAGAFSLKDRILTSGDTLVARGDSLVAVSFRQPINELGRSYSVGLETEGADFKDMAALTGSELPLSGSFDLKADIVRQKTEYSGEIKVALHPGSLYNVNYERGSFEIDLKSDEPSDVKFAIDSNGGSLKAAGAVKPFENWDIEVAARDMPIDGIKLPSMPEMKLGCDVDMDASVKGPWQRPLIEGSATLERLSLTGMRLKDSDIKVKGGSGAIKAAGAITPFENWDIDLEIKDTPAVNVKPGGKPAVEIGGNIGLDASIKGPWQRPLIEGTAALERVSLAGVRLKDYDIKVNGGSGSIKAAGAITPLESWNLNIEVDKFPLAGFNERKGPDAQFGCSASLATSVKGPWKSPRIKGAAAFGQISMAGIGLRDSEIEYDFKPDGGGFTAALLGDQVIVEGRLSTLAPFAYSFSGEINDIDLEPAFRLHQSTNIFKGSLGGSMSGEGELKNLKGSDFELLLKKFSIERKELEMHSTAPTLISYKNGLINVGETVLQSQKSELTIGGRAELLKTVEASINGSADLSLASLFVPQVTRAGGLVEIACDVSGKWKKPEITGSLEFKNCDLYFDELNQTFEGIRGKCLFNERRVIFERFSGISGGGTFSLSGDITLAELKLWDYKLSMTLKEVATSIPAWLPNTLSGTLELSGSSEKMYLTGDLTVLLALYSEDLNWEELIFRLNRRMLEPKALEPSRLNLNINLTADQNILFNNNIGKGELKGYFNITGPINRLNIIGNLEILEGEIKFLDNKFELTSGVIEFVDPYRIDPYFDITAETEKRDITVYLNWVGRLSSKQLYLSSSDQGLDQTDILTLLSVGFTRQELSERREDARDATLVETSNLITSRLTSTVAGEIKEGLGIDTFQVNPYYSATTGQTGTRITLGKQVAEDLYVTYDRLISSTSENEVVVDYNFHEMISLSGNWDDQGSNKEGEISGYIKFKFEFLKLVPELRLSTQEPPKLGNDKKIDIEDQF